MPGISPEKGPPAPHLSSRIELLLSAVTGTSCLTIRARQIGTQPIRTAFRSPWQNGVAERWVESCRRDLLDHVIVINQRHLKRLIAEYVRYYHEDRTHLGLAKDTPAGRPIGTHAPSGSKIRSFPRLGGLHHRYAVAA